MSKSHSPGEISPSFCAMPWINMATETNGKCKICCIVMTNRYIQREGMAQTLKFKKILSRRYMEFQLCARRASKNARWRERVSDCFYCHAQEDLGQQSPRQSYNAMWFDRTPFINAQCWSRESKMAMFAVCQRPLSHAREFFVI